MRSPAASSAGGRGSRAADQLPGRARAGRSVRTPRPRPGASPPLPALASTALAGLLDGPPRPARVLAASGAPAAYLEVAGDQVVAVVAREAVRLPCALVVDGAALRRLGLRAGGAALIGGGRLTAPPQPHTGIRRRSGAMAPERHQVRDGLAGAAVVRAARWWDPRPRLGAVEPAALASALEAARRLVPPWPAPGLAPALEARLRDGLAGLDEALGGSGRGLDSAARALVGLGPGSTPSGDDVLAGALAGARLLGGAAGAARAVALAGDLWRACSPLLHRTGALPATLLGHAARGEVCAPAGQLCQALVGRLPLRPAVDGLLAVGSTSGDDLAAGLLLGARAALRGAA